MTTQEAYQLKERYRKSHDRVYAIKKRLKTHMDKEIGKLKVELKEMKEINKRLKVLVEEKRAKERDGIKAPEPEAERK